MEIARLCGITLGVGSPFHVPTDVILTTDGGNSVTGRPPIRLVFKAPLPTMGLLAFRVTAFAKQAANQKAGIGDNPTQCWMLTVSDDRLTLTKPRNDVGSLQPLGSRALHVQGCLKLEYGVLCARF